MRYLTYASIALLLLGSGCARNPYRRLRTADVPATGARALLSPPRLTRELYRCVVDGRFLFRKFHLSGILLLKSFGDGSQRVVFQNELGISFFNFKWDARDSFSVTSIMPQLDKPAVIRTLRTDFELLLRKNLDTAGIRFLKAATGDPVVRVRKNTGFAWYAAHSPQVVYGKRSPVISVQADSTSATDVLPSAVRIRHHRANFTIDLGRISNADEN